MYFHWRPYKWQKWPFQDQNMYISFDGHDIWYCWWKKSGKLTSWYGTYPVSLQGFIHVNGGWSEGISEYQQYPTWGWASHCFTINGSNKLMFSWTFQGFDGASRSLFRSLEQWFIAIDYPPVNKHSNGKYPSWIGNTSSNGGFSIAMFNYRSVVIRGFSVVVVDVFFM